MTRLTALAVSVAARIEAAFPEYIEEYRVMASERKPMLTMQTKKPIT